MEERLDIVIDPTSAKRGIDVLAQAMSGLTAQTNKAQSATTKLFDSLNSGLTSVSSALLSFRAVAGAFTAIIATFRHLGQEITRFQAFISTMSVAVGSVENAKDEFKFLMDMSDRLGVSINSVSHNFAQMSAAATSSGMSMAQVRDIFTSFSIAARVMHLSNIDTRLMFYALTQMISKGVVSMEELRRQLGEKLPGAMNLAASSLNTTMPKLEAAIRKGTVDSAKFLPIFANAVKETFSPGLNNAINAFDAEVNRLDNNLKKMVVTFYELGVADSFTNVIKELNRILSDKKIAEAFADALKKLADEVTNFLKTLSPDTIKSLVDNFSSALVVMGEKAGQIMSTMKELAGYMGTIAKAWLVLKGVAMGGAAGATVSGGNPIAAAAGGVAGGMGAASIISHIEHELGVAKNRLDTNLNVRGKIGNLQDFVDSSMEGPAGGSMGVPGPLPSFRLSSSANLADVLTPGERSRKDIEKEMKAWVNSAEEAQEIADDMIYTWREFFEEDAAGIHIIERRVAMSKKEFETIEKWQKEQKEKTAENNKALVESAQLLVEAAENTIYTWNEAGQRVEMTKESFEELAAVAKKAQETGIELGFTFASAFEDAVVEGQKLRDVLHGLLQDILRVLLRKNFTEPFTKMVGGLDWTKLFGGNVSGGNFISLGDVEDMSALGIPQMAKGTDYVPQDGLAYLHKGERVVPASENRTQPGKTTVIINNETGQPVAVKTAPPRMDAGGMVMELFLSRLAVDSNARQQVDDMLKGSRSY